ncbi:hypothetical protein [Thalassospira marina]|uniref:Uncharacterized protein n=1 Tax=Thalassospira marina TaxID=2048283 RepID=A0A2N3KU22_9PROT|nr:hypothetical protein [Thalassospira marina]PKR53973.1 hypothetical protein COO20_10395 [Thalassospira marina]
MNCGPFSPTRDIDNPVLPCQQGNLFLNQLPLDAPPFSCSVNGLNTGPLPTDLIYKLGNSLDGTANRLTITPHGAREITLIEDLKQFSQNKPEDVGVYVGVLPEESSNSTRTPAIESRTDRAFRLLREYDMPSPITYSDQLREYENLIAQGNADNDTYVARNNLLAEIEDLAIQNGFMDTPTGEEDLYALEVPEWLKPSLSEGTFDLEKFTEEELHPIALAIANGLHLVDEATLMQALNDKTRGSVDFTLRGTNTVPLATELVDMLKRGENRSFLRELIKHRGGIRLGKVWINAKGNLLLSFRGYAGVRQFLNATTYAASSSKVSVISSAIRNSRNWAGSLKSVGGRIPVISYVIVGTFDVAEWLAQPEGERELSDLTGQLIVDITKIAASTLAASIAAAMVITFVASAPALLIIGAGIVAGVAVGVALDTLDSQFGVTDQVKEISTYIGGEIEKFFERLQDQATPTVPVGQVSSARMPGTFGAIPLGSETNALDVISEQNYRNRGIQ